MPVGVWLKRAEIPMHKCACSCSYNYACASILHAFLVAGKEIKEWIQGDSLIGGRLKTSFCLVDTLAP